MAKKKTIWLSYDLGLKGDYPGLYSLLDRWKAKECGPNLAVFTHEYNSIQFKAKQLIEDLKKEIKRNVKLKDTDRIYIVWKDNDSGKIKGDFIFGGRKRPGWEGYATELQATTEDSE